MEIETTRFGTLTVAEEQVIHMPRGMLGFPHSRRFVPVQHRQDSPFFWLQSAEDPALAFVLTSPFFFAPHYRVELEEVLREMSWDEKEAEGALEIYVVVNVPRGEPEKMTANLIGPIVLNNRTRQAVQMVLPNSPYSHRFPLLKRHGEGQGAAPLSPSPPGFLEKQAGQKGA